jgi:hypothetical protein
MESCEGVFCGSSQGRSACLVVIMDRVVCPSLGSDMVLGRSTQLCLASTISAF